MADMVQFRRENGKLIAQVQGKIDSSNAPVVEQAIQAKLREMLCDALEIDCDTLEYSSSAGLRVILRLKQELDNTVLTNVHPDLYNILDMTGFVDMMEVHRAYRVVNVDNCEVIGQGANGRVYRIDPDTIVKVYLNPDALPEIHRERELARLAFVAGVPTAIPYDVVRIEGGGYGSVFELLNATSFAKLLIRGEKSLEEVAKMSVDLLKLIHSKQIRSEILPDMKEVALKWADFLKDYLPAENYEKLHALIQAVPEDNHLMHGDYHIKNIMLQNGETLLIDMDTLCHGNPVFEMASIYNAYVGYGITDPETIETFMGISVEDCARMWRRTLELYLGTEDEKKVKETEEKAMIVGLTRVMRREIRRGGLERENGRQLIEMCRTRLGELLPRVETLVF